MQVRNNPANGNNFTVGRQGNKISEIVIHHAASTSFDSIGQTFQNPSRGASAHYGVGRNNNVDRYVDEANIAWHCGNWAHNSRSIGIENVNSSGSPEWAVAPETFNTLVELVTDIVRRNPNIGKLEVGRNLFGHKDVSDKPTACPVQLSFRLQELANRVNAAVSGTPVPTPTPGAKSNEQLADEVLAGKWGNNPGRRDALIGAGYDYAAIQAIVNGRVGQAPSAPRKSNEVIADEVLAGAWGNNPSRKLKLEQAGYNYEAIQAIVNNRVGSGNANAPVPARPSDEAIADQVIAGAWGNGDDRRAKLAQAGYSFDAVQAIVNRKLGIGAGAPAKKSNDQVANEVLAGNWGNGQERRDRLAAAGYDYGTIQQLVNRKLGL